MLISVIMFYLKKVTQIYKIFHTIFSIILTDDAFFQNVYGISMQVQRNINLLISLVYKFEVYCILFQENNMILIDFV